MNLRTKLIIYFMIFVIALLALGIWSAWRLREISAVTRLIMSNNYDSVVAAQDMKESIERTSEQKSTYGLRCPLGRWSVI